MKNLTITILIALIIVLLAAWRCKPKPPIIKIIQTKVPMSVRELQVFLNEQGHERYGCKVDGIFGQETKRALDNWLCDSAYKESIYMEKNIICRESK